MAHTLVVVPLMDMAVGAHMLLVAGEVLESMAEEGQLLIKAQEEESGINK